MTKGIIQCWLFGMVPITAVCKPCDQDSLIILLRNCEVTSWWFLSTVVQEFKTEIYCHLQLYEFWDEVQELVMNAPLNVNKHVGSI